MASFRYVHLTFYISSAAPFCRIFSVSAFFFLLFLFLHSLTGSFVQDSDRINFPSISSSNTHSPLILVEVETDRFVIFQLFLLVFSVLNEVCAGRGRRSDRGMYNNRRDYVENKMKVESSSSTASLNGGSQWPNGNAYNNTLLTWFDGAVNVRPTFIIHPIEASLDSKSC